jgi:hypothetical protein
MKNLTATFATVIVGLIAFTAAAQDDKAAIKAIKAIIEKETQAFFDADRKGWEETWVHSPYAYWSYSDSTGTSFVEGWDALTKNFDEYFRTQVANRSIDVAHQSNKVMIDRVWKEIRVYGNGAFVHYIQRVKDGPAERDETSQVRILEKGKDGKWKVVCVGAIASYPVDEVVVTR